MTIKSLSLTLTITRQSTQPLPAIRLHDNQPTHIFRIMQLQGSMNRELLTHPSNNFYFPFAGATTLFIGIRPDDLLDGFEYGQGTILAAFDDRRLLFLELEFSNAEVVGAFVAEEGTFCGV